jgi:hypothetical protein
VKICTKCAETKSDGEYFVRDKASGRLHAQCKECYTAQRKLTYAVHYEKYKASYLRRAKVRREELRREFQDNMLAYLSDKQCSDCKENDVRVLELDHIDAKLKAFTVSQAVKLGFSWAEVLEELKKCRVLCANCHKRRTAQQYHWYKA